LPAPAAILLDIRLDEANPDNTDGIDLLCELQEQLPSVPVLMITGHGDVDMAVECMKRGAADFIQKTVNLRELKVRLEKALERAGLSERVIRLEQELAIVEPRELIGESKGIQEIRNLIAAVARDGSISVLILGETGTGKEVVARAIHATGGRSRSLSLRCLWPSCRLRRLNRSCLAMNAGLLPAPRGLTWGSSSARMAGCSFSTKSPN